MKTTPTVTAKQQGQILRNWALAQDMTFYAIAKKIGISHSAFYNLLKGSSCPKERTIKLLIKVTGIKNWKLAKLGRPAKK